jgi:hypothetical protein
MPVTDIKEIRILPPLALGRLGSSDEPMHNYDAIAPAAGAGFRTLTPAETLVVNPQSGEVIRAVTPPDVKFRDGAGRIKPVAPFLEVWARFTDDGPFEPLTVAALSDLGLTEGDVKWAVHVGNLKMFRRSGDAGDRVTADLGADQLGGHARQELLGQAGNFRPNRTVSLGWAQYVRPTAAFPEIRLRFTPARGLVYGHTTGGVIPPERTVYDPVAGRWDTHADRPLDTSPTPRARRPTSPSGTYARTRPAPNGRRVNLGYLDDSCDGIVRASLRLGDRELRTFARVAAGPPDFAPDSFPVRSVADDFAQMLHGVEPETVTAPEVLDVVLRAVETMRLMNTETQNRQFPFWVPAAQQPFGAGRANYFQTRALHEGLLQAAQGLTAPVDSAQRQQAVAALEAISRILRAPEKTGDYSTVGPAGERPAMQRMPALMRGSDGDLLCLTRRQQNVIRKAAVQFGVPAGGKTTIPAAMTRLINQHQFAATLHSAITLPAGGTLAGLFATPDRLLAYLSDPASVARGPVAGSLGLTGKRLVTPRDPPNSAFFAMVSNPAHPMNGVLSAYQDSALQVSGVEVIRQWILSL